MTLFTPPHLLDTPRWKNMRVGLLGGSFNPPHQGHVHISLAALKALRLDAIWWLVTPQNPLKTDRPQAISTRLELCKDLVKHPKIIVSDLEQHIDAHKTYDVVRHLKKRYAQTDFVWISGMDTAQSLHRWAHWQALLSEICMLHLTRSPQYSLVRRSPLKNYARQSHVFIENAGDFPLSPQTTYWMMQKKTIDVSSTEIRKKLLLKQADI